MASDADIDSRDPMPPAGMTLAAGLLLGLVVIGLATLFLTRRQTAIDNALFAKQIEEIRSYWSAAAQLRGTARVDTANRALEAAEVFYRGHPWNPSAHRFWREARLVRGEALLGLGGEQVLSAALEDFLVAELDEDGGSETDSLLPRALLGQGRALYQLGNDAGARRALDRLLARCPVYAAGYKLRAKVCRRLGDAEQAERDEKEALRLGERLDDKR